MSDHVKPFLMDLLMFLIVILTPSIMFIGEK